MILHKDLIIRRTDNPHELLIAKCSKCFVRQDDDRIKLHLDGWTVQTLHGAEFTLCPDCSGKDYVWEDLY